MSSALYNSYKESLLSQSPVTDLDTDTIKAALVMSASYTFSAAHAFVSDLGAGRAATTDQTLGSKTVAAGVFDAADVSFPAVTGTSVNAIVLYKDTGVAGTSPLIAYIDTASAGLPVVPNGGAIAVAWDNGTNKIFKIG